MNLVNLLYEIYGDNMNKSFFLEPANPAQRQYEALRAHFVDGVPQAEAAKRFGYTPGSYRVMLHKMRKEAPPSFFIESRKSGDGKKANDPLHEIIISLRKRNMSVYDIAAHLRADGRTLSAPAISNVLRLNGFSKLPRRRDDERPEVSRPERAAVADVRELDLSNRSFHTRFGGLFLFAPFIVKLGLDDIVSRIDLPGSNMIPAGQAVRSLLALKLFGDARHTHVMSDVFDQGLALFAGLNTIPKCSFLTQYSCRIAPKAHLSLIREWFDEVEKLGWAHGNSFDLDFHTIPFHGEDALVEKHYVSKRSRRQKGMLAFVVSDDQNRAFCYVDADIRKSDMNDQILIFADFWREKNGQWPTELVFDSKLTTYANLNEINKRGIRFITLRRRSPAVIEQIHDVPLSAWRKIQLANIARAYRTPRIWESKISLKDYEGELRQIAVKDLGHAEATVLITNQIKASPATLIQRYARRMIIENNISDVIDFFHMDALSSVVPMKINCDLAVTLMASALYRLLAARVGYGYPTAEFRKIFRDLVRATASVSIEGERIIVRFQKRAHNPMLMNAGIADETTVVPWLGGKRLQLQFG